MKKKHPVSWYEERYGEEIVNIVRLSIDYFSIKEVAKKVGLSLDITFQIAHAIYRDRGHQRMCPTEIVEQANVKKLIDALAASGKTASQAAKELAKKGLTSRVRGMYVARAWGSLCADNDRRSTAEQIKKRNEKRSRNLSDIQIAQLAKQKQAEKARQVIVSRIVADLRGRRLSPADAEAMYGKKATQDALAKIGSHEKLKMLQDIDRPAQMRFMRENWQLSDRKMAFFLDTSQRQIIEARKRIKE